MTITKTATITINEEKAQLFLDALINRAHFLTKCTCDQCLDKTTTERAKDIRSIYCTAYDISKIPKHSTIKIPSLDEIKQLVYVFIYKR
jgi:hypothetical protein